MKQKFESITNNLQEVQGLALVSLKTALEAVAEYSPLSERRRDEIKRTLIDLKIPETQVNEILEEHYYKILDWFYVKIFLRAVNVSEEKEPLLYSLLNQFYPPSPDEILHYFEDNDVEILESPESANVS